MAEQRGYSPEELGLIPRAAEAPRGYTPEELGLIPKTAEQRGYTPEELGLVPKTAKPEPKPEDQSALRQVADLPLQAGKGAVTGIRLVADAFGAGSDISKTLKGGEDYLAGLMSAQSKQDSQEIARIMKDAEDKGFLDQVKAGLKALSIAPADTVVNALGTSAPAIIGGLAAAVGGAPALAVSAVGAGIGAAMGAGTVKSTIYDAVKEELSKTSMPKEQIEARAQLAQEYRGQNLDMILTGMAVGTIGATTGVEPALARNLAKGIISKAAQKEIVDKANEEATKLIATRGIKKHAAITGAQEFATEFTQAGQEQFAENLALRREGYDVPLMRGVVSNAVLEGAAGLGMGLGVGAKSGYDAKQATKAETKVKEELRDVLIEHFEAAGEKAPNKSELDSLIDDVIKTKQEEIKNGTVAGTDQSSVPVSTEQPEQAAAEGTGLPTAGDVGAAGQAVAGTGDGTTVQSDTLAQPPIEQDAVDTTPEQTEETLVNKFQTVKEELSTAKEKLNELIYATKPSKEPEALVAFETQFENAKKEVELKKTELDSIADQIDTLSQKKPATVDTTETTTPPVDIKQLALYLFDQDIAAGYDPYQPSDWSMGKNRPAKFENNIDWLRSLVAENTQLANAVVGGYPVNLIKKAKETITETAPQAVEAVTPDIQQIATEFVDSIMDRTIKPARKDINGIAYKLGLDVGIDTSNADALQQIKDAIQYTPKEPIKPEAGTSTTPKTEEELEEQFLANAEIFIDQQPIGLALQRIENGDFETKAKLKTFVNRLARDGVLDDIEDLLLAFGEREQTVDDVLDMLRDQLDEARETAIDENIDEQRNDYDLSVAAEETPVVKEAAPEMSAEQVKALDEMSEADTKLRTRNNVPLISTLPADLQEDVNVQEYHNLFDSWLDANAIDDKVEVKRLSSELGKLRGTLPKAHPAALPKAQPSKKTKGKKSTDISPSEITPTPTPTEDTVPVVSRNIMRGVIHPLIYNAIKTGNLKNVLDAIIKTSNNMPYIRDLAKNLSQFNMSPEIGFDIQESLLERYAARVKDQVNRFDDFMQLAYPKIYEAHLNEANMATPLVDKTYGYYFILNNITKLKLDLTGYKKDFLDIIDTYQHIPTSYYAQGVYVGGTVDGISLNSDNNVRSTSYHTLLHEIVHAATQWAINNKDLLSPDQQKALRTLERLYNYTRAISKDAYGFKNLHEFVAEAFTNPDFQAVLKNIKYNPTGNKFEPSSKSLWSRFMQTVYNILASKGIGTYNVFFHTLANTEILFSASSNNAKGGLFTPLFAPPVSKTKPKTKRKTKAQKILEPTRVNEKENTSFVDSIMQGSPTWKDIDKKNLVNFYNNFKDQYRKYLLGALTLDQLTDIVGEAMPQFKRYVKAVDAMHNTRNEILIEGEESIASWSRLQESNRGKADELSSAMIEATFAKVDPDPKGKGHDAKKLTNTTAGKKAQAAWDALTAGPNADTAVKIYRDVREFYEKRMNEYIRVQLNRLAQKQKADGASDAEIKDALKKKLDEIEESIIKPYFPIKRFGEYWLQIGKGTNKIFLQFEDSTARNLQYQEEVNRISKELIKTSPTLTKEKAIEEAKKELDAGNSFSTEMNRKLAELEHLKEINNLVNSTTESVQTSNLPGDKVEELRASLIDGFGQWYLEMMPQQSIQKMFIHRKNVPGLSGDMLRAFMESRQRVAYQRARFEHLPNLFNEIAAANDYLKLMPTDERIKWRDYVRELELNLKTAILEPPKQSGWVTTLTQFGFLNYLTAPASALINAMAIPGIYIPAAAPKYGTANVMTSLARYNRMLGSTGFINEKTKRIEFLSLARANLQDLDFAGTAADNIKLPSGRTMANVYEAGVRVGAIDTTQAHDAGALGEQSSDQYTGRWQKIMYYASLPFHAAEKYNRETTFMATFDMAYRKYITKGYTKEKAYDAAVDDARDLVQTTMFNYNTVNKPRYFRGNFRNVLLQFKMYPQHMTVLMFRTFQKGWASNTEDELKRAKLQVANSPIDVQEKFLADKRAELKQMGKEAREQFLGMMGMTFLFTGLSGLPLFFIFEGIAKAFHAVFGDDEEPFNVDNWFKNWCNRTFGGFMGATISRGLLSEATGLNFADRMSIDLSNMWFRDVKQSNDEVQYAQSMMTNLMGPSAGALLNYVEAIKRYKDGYTERAVETMMPSAIKNVMIGTRYLVEGKALTMKGATLDDEVTAPEAIAQMLGFSPADTATKQKAAYEFKNTAEAVKDRHTSLLNAFFIALDSGDTDMMGTVLEKMQKFSVTNPGERIDADSLIDSVQKRYKDRAMANITGGIGINPKMIPQLNQMLDYSKRE
jgi:hypothetical protein